MRYGILSDVHSNLEALEVVLAAVAKDGIDQLLCAGDLIGYGPDPVSCLERLTRKIAHAVCGNHDCAAAGRLELDWFNDTARAAVEWTVGQLSKEERDYLHDLPLVWQNAEVTVVHGSLEEPEQFHYIFDLADAETCLKLQQTPVAFIGHTHVPGIFIQEGSRIAFHRPQQPVHLNPRLKYLVNVGSVGQPRDGDPRAAYCLYDTSAPSVEIRRVSYSITKTQEKMRTAGLPEFLAQRLDSGH